MEAVTAQELRSLLADQAAPLLDVRSAGDYETAHIPGAVRVGLDELRAAPGAVAATLPDGAVVICRSGARAEQAGEMLTLAGRNDVRILAGGMVAWERAGGELERDRQRWDLERQVRLFAGVLVLTGVAGSLLWPPALLLAGGIGAGLSVAAATDTCAMGTLLAKLPYNRSAACETPRIAERFAHLAARGTPGA